MTGPAALRVLHVIARMIGGGPERSVLAIAERTAAMGIDHRHTIVVLDPPVSSRLVLRARRLGVRVVPRPDAATLCDLVAEADVVQLHWWNHPVLRQTMETVELPPCRLLVWARVLGTTAPQVLTADVGRFADTLVVTSPGSTASGAARVATDAGTPVEHIPGLADMTRLDGFTPHPTAEGCVGYVGLVNDTKMHPRFAELCAAVPDERVRFVVCGGGGGEDELRRRGDAVGLGARLEVRGHVEELRGALEAFDVFGYPLAPETSATSEKALQEAMWVGIPPVLLPHPGTDGLVEPGVSGLVVAEADYPEAVGRLLADETLRRRLGEGARRHARAAFDPDRWTRRTIEVLDELRDRPRRSRGVLTDDAGGAAARFVRSLGELGGAFEVSRRGPTVAGDAAVAEADRTIAGSSANLARGEGGIVHYRNTYPDDPHLRLWSALVSGAAGRPEVAASELTAAAELGLGDDRPIRYRAELPS